MATRWCKVPPAHEHRPNRISNVPTNANPSNTTSDLTHTYRADIDGLRALAVLPVVFYHAGFATFSGGYVGVDVFFVISGYLITALLLSEIQQQRFRLRSFYIRRARRLFPALFAVLFACCIPAYLLLMPQELEDFGQSLATTAIFSSNFLFFSEAGYFEGPAELKPLLHTWSLAIEEQYYLLFPGFLLLIHRWLGQRYFATTAALWVLSFGISVWSVQHAPSAAFFLLPSRTWELLTGSLLAMGLANRPVAAHVAPAQRVFLEAMGWLGLACIAFAVFAYRPTTPFPGTAALLPCVGTALLILSGALGPTTASRFLSLKPLVFIGLVSYSLYLWHWPMLAFAKHFALRELTQLEVWACISAAVAAAVLSWRYIERPFRGSQGVLTTPGLAKLAAACMLLTIVVGLIFDASEGMPSRLNPSAAANIAIAQDKPESRKRCEGKPASEVTLETLCKVNDTAAEATFLVWGDSHAAMLMPALAHASKAAGINGLNATSNGCAPFIGYANTVAFKHQACIDFNNAVFELMQQNPNITTLVLVARWARYAEPDPYQDESGEPILLGSSTQTATNAAENHVIYREAVERTLSRLHWLKRHIVVLGPIPELGVDAPTVLAKAAQLRRSLNLDLPLAEFQRRQARTLPLFKHAKNIGLIDYYPTHPYFCDDEYCRSTLDSLPIYTDDDHLASSGAALLNPLLEKLMLDMVDRHD